MTHKQKGWVTTRPDAGVRYRPCMPTYTMIEQGASLKGAGSGTATHPLT
jgi:hypothetical protein